MVSELRSASFLFLFLFFPPSPFFFLSSSLSFFFILRLSSVILNFVRVCVCVCVYARITGYKSFHAGSTNKCINNNFYMNFYELKAWMDVIYIYIYIVEKIVYFQNITSGEGI